MTTIRDVAKHANVSVATVSRVLNKNGYVNEETKQKVLEVIKSLNYKPNAVARSLYKKSSKTLGLILPDITNPFFPELAKAVEDVANRSGYTLLFYNSEEQVEKEQIYIENLKQKYIDGVILATNSLNKQQVEGLEIPIVVVDRAINKNIPTVITKNYEGGKLATKYLKEIGCRVIAHIKGPDRNINAEQRFKGYIEEVSNEPWFHEELIIHGNYNMRTATEVTKKLLNKFPEIDGIFAGNDVMAVGAIKAAHQLGRKIPDDLSIIGFDGIALGEMTIPELTTIAQPIYRMGELATHILINLIEGKAIKQTYYELDIQLIKRESTKRA
ncbi:LacI family DNA-binding transcriptional regulator [Tepidibacillus infernus]|uniref:Catabolite control protein A n=1 Tax=Tepidibacillus decaturensis TaxID=1413211 RepID=A0A135L5I3_9BACI|nr:LacI family DNA-binding transcriptional regulator [Tepidibacillus decaturensis]KXG44190.1 transcriptional regulator [Tepidibacillus decaturensis]